MIEVHLLRYVLAAADSGSFSRAAAEFNVKQSTLSKRIQYLELRLGLPIFRRSTRGVVPTDPGRQFLRKARHIMEAVDDLTRQSQLLAGGEAGVLRLGCHGSLGQGDLSAALEAFRSSWPGVEIEAREANRARLLDAVEGGRLDVAIVAGQEQRAAIRSVSLWSDPVLVALDPDNPLAARSPLYWTDLRSSRFIVGAGDPGPDLAALITARLSGPGHRPVIAAQDVGRESLVAFAKGASVAVTTGILLPDDNKTGPVLRQIHDAFGPTRLSQGVHWRAENDNPALRRFLELLARHHGRPLATFPRH